MAPPPLPFRLFLLCLLCLAPPALRAESVDFALPAQPGDEALLAFAKQAGADVLFSYDELHPVRTNAVEGRYEPDEALSRLLEHTGFMARRNGKKKYIVTLALRPTGTIRGRLLQPDGRTPAAGLAVTLESLNLGATVDENGFFDFASVPPGTYALVARGREYRPLTLTGVRVRANRLTSLKPQALQVAGDVTQLEPFVVQAGANQVWPGGHDHGVLPLRVAAGNLDLPRSADDALAFQIYHRELLLRSGVVNLNDFLQRELLDSNGATLLPGKNAETDAFFSGSSNLELRGFGVAETVILVNGRRLPELLTNFSKSPGEQLPDVNFIPLSMVQQVEVLPVSASSLYTGNPVGGVINIVLRPDLNATEVTATYSNATAGFDAPQSSLTLQHGQTLLDGKLRLRLSASQTRVMPATEAELGLIAAHNRTTATPPATLFRATPNVRSANGDPLFGPGTAPSTSVAPGASGTGGLAAFAGRQGVPSLELFQAGPGLVTSPNSTGFAYGRRQQRTTYFGSVVYDVSPWLQIGIDGNWSRSTINPGLNLFAADLTLPAGSPFNPFGQDVLVALNESTPRLGERYNEARMDFSSAVLGVLLKLPGDWRVAFDAQFARTVTRYRGLSQIGTERWQELVDQGLYNPLRDTQVSAPPQAFYDRVLAHYGQPGSTVTLGNYSSLDTAVRVTNQSLQLPTGLSAVNLGADFRSNHLAAFTDEQHFGDGSVVGTPEEWSGRTLQRWSVFGELQVPLLPPRWLPRGIRAVETDLAVRYIGARDAKESYVSPTVGLKLDLAGGFSFRSSVTTSSRYPTPFLSRQIPTAGGGTGVKTASIADPLRGESYTVRELELLNPDLRPESAVTQTAGLVFQRGRIHHLRAALDYFDTSKTNELVFLNPQTVMNLESVFPWRVTRAPRPPGDPKPAGLVTAVSTSTINLASRHSQNWNGSLDYTWNQCLGGSLRLNGRLVYFQSFKSKILPTDPVNNELTNPTGTALGLLRYRAAFGAAWSKQDFSFGLDGRYYHSRPLRLDESLIQGSDHIAAHWQFDAFVQGDLTRWLPGHPSAPDGRRRYGLHGQLRIDNLLDASFPRYANDSTGAGVQPYGDWRGRTYSLSLTATF